MSNYYPPNTRAGGGGVGEAYAVDQSVYTQQMPQQYNNGESDQSSTSYDTPRTTGGGGQSQRGGSVSGASFSSHYYPPGERSVAASSYAGTNYNNNPDDIDHSQYSASASRMSRALYEDAQSQSTSRTGGILYHKGVASSRRSFQEGSSTSNSGSGLNSSLRSGSTPGAVTPLSGGPTYFNHHAQHRPIGISLSGNLLVHVQIDEEPELELDKDELRKLANTTKTNENDAASEAHFLSLNDGSTIGTTRSTASKISKLSKDIIVTGNPNNSYNILNGPQTDIEQQKIKMKEIIFSPPFRRSLFLGICFVLLALGVLLTMENFMSVKTASDWVEPHRDKYLMDNGGGGIDWAFGSDAPKPIAGAAIDYSVENHIADWAHGTSRVPATASMDGFGTVALSETVMFKDVPLFWGLPFAGEEILETVLGQCLNLVQASDKGIQDGGGDDLHLSTVPVMGRTYINVDLSNQEGIERASALALGTSGMADVAYSPLLHEVSELFSTMNQGRLFIIVRHPVEREFARFRYLLKSDQGKLLESDKSMSYVEFAHSDYVADNWMTRTLVRKGEDDELTAKDMHTAKEILRRKALVGLYSDIFGAARHYARHFGWDHARNGGELNKGALSCFERAILDGMKKDLDGTDNLVDDEAREGSGAWQKIMEKNRFDFELFVYSQQLYKFQIALS